ncbi:MAG: hypothetical protein ABIG43_03385 [Chloroflexota bacterium]
MKNKTIEPIIANIWYVDKKTLLKTIGHSGLRVSLSGLIQNWKHQIWSDTTRFL